MAQMTPERMQEFLSQTRQGILLSTRSDGVADGVPIWFDWDGESVRFFSSATAPKVDRLRRDPRIAVLVVNDLDETPAWVRFEGDAEIDDEADAKTLAVDVLAPRYWDLTEPGYASVVEQWAAAPSDAFVVIRLRPTAVRSSD